MPKNCILFGYQNFQHPCQRGVVFIFFQVHDLTKKLERSRANEQSTKDALRKSRVMGEGLEAELVATGARLAKAEEKVGQSAQLVKTLEEDAGAEFRSWMHLLERKLADATAQVCATCVYVSVQGFGWLGKF